MNVTVAPMTFLLYLDGKLWLLLALEKYLGK